MTMFEILDVFIWFDRVIEISTVISRWILSSVFCVREFFWCVIHSQTTWLQHYLFALSLGIQIPMLKKRKKIEQHETKKCPRHSCSLHADTRFALHTYSAHSMGKNNILCQQQLNSIFPCPYKISWGAILNIILNWPATYEWRILFTRP